MRSVAIGFGLGFLVALQVGPLSLFLIRCTLRRGLGVGLSVGAGIATIDAVYAALGTAGATSVLSIRSVHTATASNPSTIVSWAAIFAAASSLGHGSAPLVVLGVGLGSISWVTCLALLTAVVRRHIGTGATAAADVIAGTGMLGFAGVLSYRTAKTI